MNAGLAEALRAGASGICSQQAAAELLIDLATFLDRRDFTSRFVEHSVSISDGVTAIASIDWPAAITALDTGGLACSGGERRMLKLAASFAGGIPVDLRDTITGLDDHNVSLVVTAVLRAAGQHW
ncbi:MAG: hypothetical protein ACRDRJ_27790 [Streptosporangiaceae bacterium]